MYIVAYPADFIRSKKGKSCRSRKGDVLKEFLFRHQNNSNASTSLLECERYCSNQQHCWGCSINCGDEDNCQFNAISNCNKEEDWKGLIVGDVTEKPGVFQNCTFSY